MIRAVVCTFLLVTAAAAQETKPVVHPEDIVESVRKHYPPLLAALGDIEIAEADLLSARGRFDTVLRATAVSDQMGFYDVRRVDTWIDQPTTMQGLSFFSGYRAGLGNFAPYDGKLATRDLGEAYTGVRLPLFRDRAIDSRRGELAKARIGTRLAQLSVEQQKLTILQAALTRYWVWVGAVRRLNVAREMLQVAESRQKLLEEGVQAGQLPGIEATENSRAVVQRRSAMIDADRAARGAAIDLSLYYRNAAGEPVVPAPDQAPVQFPQPVTLTDSEVQEDLRAALRKRPELSRLEAQQDQIEVDIDLAKNAAKPAVDLSAGFVNAMGTPNPLVKRGPQEFRTGLSFEFPLQNRRAKGQQAAAEARNRQTGQRIRFLQNQITAEVQDATAFVETARQKLEALRAEVRLSLDLEQAERLRFELGEGTLFMLNLRELATADAALREAAAQADYQRAVTAYEAATGELLER